MKKAKNDELLPAIRKLKLVAAPDNTLPRLNKAIHANTTGLRPNAFLTQYQKTI